MKSVLNYKLQFWDSHFAKGGKSFECPKIISKNILGVCDESLKEQDPPNWLNGGSRNVWNKREIFAAIGLFKVSKRSVRTSKWSKKVLVLGEC